MLFAGSQKNLTLSIVFQVSLFPELHLVLVICVVHHVIHPLIDGYLVGRLGDRNKVTATEVRAL